MADDEKDLEAPKSPEKTAQPLTEDAFIDEMNKLIERGDAAGLQPRRLMTRILLDQSRGVINRLFTALEEGYVKGKKE